MSCPYPKNHPSTGPFSCRKCGMDCKIESHKYWRESFSRRNTMFRKWWRCENCGEKYMIESQRCYPEDLKKELPPKPDKEKREELTLF